MTHMTKEEILAVLTAFVNGKRLEYKDPAAIGEFQRHAPWIEYEGDILFLMSLITDGGLVRISVVELYNELTGRLTCVPRRDEA